MSHPVPAGTTPQEWEESWSLPPQVRSLLRCPVTGEELVDVTGPDGRPALLARRAGRLYPVRGGVAVLLPQEAIELGTELP